MRAKKPRVGKRIGLGLLVVSSGWLVASGFRTDGAFTGRKAVTPAERHVESEVESLVKRDLRLLIRNEPDSDSMKYPSTDTSYPSIASLESAKAAEVMDGTTIPELQRDSPIPLRTSVNQAPRAGNSR